MKIVVSFAMALLLVACSGNNGDRVVYNGRLESDIIRISAEAAGKIDTLKAQEGQSVQKGQLLAVINSDKIMVRLAQQLTQFQEVNIGLLALKTQEKEINAQLKLTKTTLAKTKNMVASGAATEQKLDELETQLEILLTKQEALKIQESMLANKKEQLISVIELTKISLDDTRISAPLDGQVLNRFVNLDELCAPGMALFEIADLTKLEANIYLPLALLGDVKLGTAVEVSVDGQEETFRGSVKWISSESEFTPKTILTEETRTTLVYRVKVEIPNPNGVLKIGMPVDVTF